MHRRWWAKLAAAAGTGLWRERDGVHGGLRLGAAAARGGPRQRTLAGGYREAVDLDALDVAAAQAARGGDVRETGQPDQVEILLLGQGAVDTAGPARRVAPPAHGEGPVGDYVADAQPAAGPEDAVGFFEDPPLILAQVDDAIGEDDVDRAVVDRHGFGVAQAKLYLAQPSVLGRAAGA